MPLSVFIDALPYNEIKANYTNWFDNMQVAELVPNIAYSSSLHWQLYCDKYPDDRGVLVDWAKEPEKNKLINLISTILSPLDNMGCLGFLSRKVLDRIVFRRNVFANVPYKFRKHFTEKGQYLFWDVNTYSQEEVFDGYCVVSQDEGHLSFEQTMEKLRNCVEKKHKDIFAVFGFADSLGHTVRRGELYSSRLKVYMDDLQKVISDYKSNYPEEEVLIISDHGMSTVEDTVDFELEKNFGRQSTQTYIAYCDSAVMCIWTEDKSLEKKLCEYLKTREEGHLLTENERNIYGATDRKFGNIIYILKEGKVFHENWFGKSVVKSGSDGYGMHGFWPDREARDQMACVVLIDGKRHLNDLYDYPQAHEVIKAVMKGEK